MSGISGVGYGNSYAVPKFCGTGEKKESHAVRNGALIGAGVGAAGQSFLTYKLCKAVGLKSCEIGYGKVACGVGVSALLFGLIGAGIGAIVKACSGNTENMVGK